MTIHKRNIIFSLSLLIMLSFFSYSVNATTLIPDQNKKGKWGFVDDSGKKIINYDYDEVSGFNDGRAKVKKGDKYGYINESGKEVIKIKFSEMGTWSNGRCKVAEGGSIKNGELKDAKWGFINQNGEYLLKTEYSVISPFVNGMAYVIKDKKYGYIDDGLRSIIPPKYSAIGSFNEQKICWVNEGGKLDPKTNIVKGGKFGVYTRDGQLIVPCKYLGIGTFKITPPDANPLISKCYMDESFRDRNKELLKTLQKDMTKTGLKAGLLAGLGGKGLAQDILDDDSEQLKKIMEAESELNNIMALSLPSDEIIVKNECGTYQILAPEFISGELFSSLDMSLSDMIAVRKSASSGFMKAIGYDKEAMNAQTKAFAAKFSNYNTFTSPKTDKPGIITIDGRVLLEPGKYPAAYLPSNGLVPVVKWGKNISIGKDKISILQINYHNIGTDKLLFKKWIDATMITPFHNGSAVVTYLDKSYIISEKGERISQNYDLIIPAREDVHVVKRDGKYGLLSISGQEVIPPSFEFIAPASDGLFTAKRAVNEPYGYINAKGEFVLDPQFIHANSFAYGTAKIKSKDGWGIIGKEGTLIVEPKYEDIKSFTTVNPSETWVKTNGLWKVLDNSTKNISFETNFVDVFNFNPDGNAIVLDQEGKYGLISRKGDTIIPTGLSSPDMVEGCLTEMKDSGKETYRLIDVYRFNVRNHKRLNKNKLSETVNSELWDF